MLKLTNITKRFRSSQKNDYVYALNDVSLEIKENDIFGLVGESGSGKSTTAKLISRLIKPSSGKIEYKGEDINNFNNTEVRKFRSEVQMIFQDPYASLNPKMKVKSIIEEPLIINKIKNKKDRLDMVAEISKLVGLNEDSIYKYPHQFSGGQRQRINIARALISNPKLLLLDEPISALDVSIQAQILNLLKELRKKYNLTYYFISHDLSVVEYFCNKIGILYLGKLMELSDNEKIFNSPLNPYTQVLLSAIPVVNEKKKREKIVIQGHPTTNTLEITGCPFYARCPFAQDICKVEEPVLREVKEKHYVACHFA